MKDQIIQLFNADRDTNIGKLQTTYAFLSRKKAFETTVTEAGFIKVVMAELVSEQGINDFIDGGRDKEEALNEALSFAQDRVIAATCPKHHAKSNRQADQAMARMDAKHDNLNRWKRQAH